VQKFGARLHPHFSEHCGNAELDRSNADAQMGSNLFVYFAFQQKVYNYAFDWIQYAEAIVNFLVIEGDPLLFPIRSQGVLDHVQ
jgi:hypothetical protein